MLADIRSPKRGVGREAPGFSRGEDSKTRTLEFFHWLLGIIDDPEWMDDAACKGMGTVEPAMCRMCPVKLECLEFALKNQYEGYWGGTSDAERRRIMLRRR